MCEWTARLRSRSYECYRRAGWGCRGAGWESVHMENEAAGTSCKGSRRTRGRRSRLDGSFAYWLARDTCWRVNFEDEGRSAFTGWYMSPDYNVFL